MNVGLSQSPFFWDPGTLNCRLYSHDQGMIADVPSVFLRHHDTRAIYYQGVEALALLEKVPPGLELVRGIERGLIADPAMSSLFSEMVGQASWGALAKIVRPSCVAVVRSNQDSVHTAALKVALTRAGFGTVIQIPQLAAICISHDEEALLRGCLVWDGGAGKIEIGALGSGDVIASEVLPWGGDKLDERIKEFVEQEMHFLISLSDARRLKDTVSLGKRKNKETYVLGKNLKQMKIEPLTVSSEGLREVVVSFLTETVLAFQSFLLTLPSSFMGISKESGLLLSGGLSQIDGIDDWFTQQAELPVRRLPRQHIASLLGATKIWMQWEKYSYLAVQNDV